MLYTFIYICKYRQIQYRWTLMLQVRTRLITSDFGSWWHEERDTILTIVTPSQRAAHLKSLRSQFISAGRDPENLTAAATVVNLTLCLHGPTSTDSFQNPQILRTISSGHVVIYTPAPFSVWGFIMTMVIVIFFAHERKIASNDYAPELKAE